MVFALYDTTKVISYGVQERIDWNKGSLRLEGHGEALSNSLKIIRRKNYKNNLKSTNFMRLK